MQDLASTFAGYRLHHLIGHDAVSTTYRATAESPARGTVAVQISGPLEDGVERRRATLFQHKATAATDVREPGIARVVDAGIAQDRAYVVTAWRPAITLDAPIGWRGGLAPQGPGALRHSGDAGPRAPRTTHPDEQDGDRWTPDAPSATATGQAPVNTPSAAPTPAATMDDGAMMASAVLRV